MDKSVAVADQVSKESEDDRGADAQKDEEEFV